MAENFGKRLKKLRKKAGLTQEQLAEKINIHETTVRRWENKGNIPNGALLPRISEALGVSENELFNDPLPDNTGGWVINIKTATNFTEEAVDLRGNVCPITNISQTPAGVSFTVQASWAKIDEIKGLRELFTEIEKVYPAIRQGGVAIGGLKPNDEENESKRRRRKKRAKGSS